MRYLWLLAWIVFIMIGAFIGTIIPDDFTYITGFIFGCFSPIFLQLFDASKNNDK